MAFAAVCAGERQAMISPAVQAKYLVTHMPNGTPVCQSCPR